MLRCLAPVQCCWSVMSAVKPDSVSALEVEESSITVNSATLTWNSPTPEVPYYHQGILFRVSVYCSADNNVHVSSVVLYAVTVTELHSSTIRGLELPNILAQPRDPAPIIPTKTPIINNSLHFAGMRSSAPHKQ